VRYTGTTLGVHHTPNHRKEQHESKSLHHNRAQILGITRRGESLYEPRAQDGAGTPPNHAAKLATPLHGEAHMKTVMLISFTFWAGLSLSFLIPEGMWLWLAIFGASCFGLAGAIMLDD